MVNFKVNDRELSAPKGTTILDAARKAGIRCITLEEGDELIAVRETDGEQAILIVSHDGMAICF